MLMLVDIEEVSGDIKRLGLKGKIRQSSEFSFSGITLLLLLNLITN